jgi:hypothetical protein
LNELRMQPNWRMLYICGIIGLLIFVPIQFLPATNSAFFGNESFDVISKPEAEAKASAFVEQKFGGSITYAKAVHQSDKMLNGYLSREKLVNDYEKIYDPRFPADSYQVEVRSKESPDGFMQTRFVQLHMKTSKIVSWNEVSSDSAGSSAKLSNEEASFAAKAFAQDQGFKAAELKMPEMPEKNGTFVIDVAGTTAGDAQLQLRIRPVFAGGNTIGIAEYKPTFHVPDSYTAYVKQQDRIASLLTLLGYLLMTIVMFVLAIVYAALYRKHTSFVRGLVLTGIFLAAYLYNTINMSDGIRASLGELPAIDSVMNVTMIVTVLITVGLAVSVYFSLVAGDGLWRSMHRNLWPRWGEAGYGEHVWKAMKIGYWFAFIILGLQSLILLALEKGTGAWSTTDVTQSPLNMAVPWLFPLLAWCAAISEEAVYRLFGVAIFRKWFRNTYAAAIIPTVVWALGHVTYPIYPATTRLVELTLLGFVFCFVFIRFGFIAAVFTHAILDSILMAISLLYLGSPVNIAAAAIYIVLPLPIAWLIRYFSQRKRMRPGPDIQAQQ